MKAWLSRFAWQLSVTLGLIERLQPIPVRSDEQRRLAEARRQRRP